MVEIQWFIYLFVCLILTSANDETSLSTMVRGWEN